MCAQRDVTPAPALPFVRSCKKRDSAPQNSAAPAPKTPPGGGGERPPRGCPQTLSPNLAPSPPQPRPRFASGLKPGLEPSRAAHLHRFSLLAAKLSLNPRLNLRGLGVVGCFFSFPRFKSTPIPVPKKIIMGGKSAELKFFPRCRVAPGR